MGTIRDDQEGIMPMEKMAPTIGQSDEPGRHTVAARDTTMLSAFIEYEFRDTTAIQVRHRVRH